MIAAGAWIGDTAADDESADLLVADGVSPLEAIGNDDDTTDWLYTDTETS